MSGGKSRKSKNLFTTCVSSSDEGCAYSEDQLAATFKDQASALRSRNRRRWKAMSVSPSPYVGRSRLPTPEPRQAEVAGEETRRNSSKRPNSPDLEREATRARRQRNFTGPLTCRRESQRRVRKLVEMKRERLKRSFNEDETDSEREDARKLHITEDFLVDRLSSLALNDASRMPTSSSSISESLAKLLNDRLGMPSTSNPVCTSQARDPASSDEEANGYDADDEDDLKRKAGERTSNALPPTPDHFDALSTYDLDSLYPASTVYNNNDSTDDNLPDIRAQLMTDSEPEIENYYVQAGIPQEAGDDFFYQEEM